MNCYNCGCRLTDNDFCTNCGASVGLYKKIVRISNQYYNFGLEKATVRDLSGAIVCLKQSLKLNKNNIEARNLLGLVYFEMGETVSALSEWVISKNIQPKKNVADDYINAIQANPGRLDTINQTIKKYNQALTYCRQGSQDLAVIQLKKVLSLNPRYVQAHQLLALLYMNMEDWEKAKRELTKCVAIDTNNTTTLRYMKEVNSMVNVDDVKANPKKKKDKEGDSLKKSSENHDVMLRPIEMKEPNGMSTIINIVIGAVIGIAIAWFLILPARIQNANAVKQTEIDGYMEQLSQKNEENQDLTTQNNELIARVGELELSLNGYTGTEEMINAYERLLYAAYLYLSPDYDEMAVAEAMDLIEDTDYASGSENYKAVYDNLLLLIGETAARQYYNLGMTEYNASSYETAITYLLQAVKYNPNDVESLYNLGNAYRLNENKEEAIEVYTRLIELFPNSSRVNRANRYLSDYENE